MHRGIQYRYACLCLGANLEISCLCESMHPQALWVYVLIYRLFYSNEELRRSYNVQAEDAMNGQESDSSQVGVDEDREELISDP